MENYDKDKKKSKTGQIKREEKKMKKITDRGREKNA